ncbi:MAG: hypothetical protein DIU67_007990 [Actinomycetes bacterium]
MWFIDLTQAIGLGIAAVAAAVVVLGPVIIEFFESVPRKAR